jgi:hypothetical protein
MDIITVKLRCIMYFSRGFLVSVFYDVESNHVL